LFAAVRARGEQLAAGHLLRRVAGQEAIRLLVEPDHAETSWTLAAGHPRYDGSMIHICEGVSVTGVSAEVWNYHVGGYQVCRKWLRDRRAQVITTADLQIYCHMLGVLADTLVQVQHIDQEIERHGGWPDAFSASEG
jgi:hypothetical protein